MTLQITIDTYNYRPINTDIISDRFALFTIKDIPNETLSADNVKCYRAISKKDALKNIENNYLLQKPLHDIVMISTSGKNIESISALLSQSKQVIKSSHKLVMNLKNTKNIIYRRKYSVAFIVLENAQIYHKHIFNRLKNIAFSCAAYVNFIVLSSTKFKKYPYTICDPSIANAIYERIQVKRHNNINVISYFNKPKIHAQRVVLNILIQYNRISQLTPQELEIFSKKLYQK